MTFGTLILYAVALLTVVCIISAVRLERRARMFRLPFDDLEDVGNGKVYPRELLEERRQQRAQRNMGDLLDRVEWTWVTDHVPSSWLTSPGPGTEHEGMHTNELPAHIAAVVAKVRSYHPAEDGYAAPVVTFVDGYYTIVVEPGTYSEPGDDNHFEALMIATGPSVWRGLDPTSSTCGHHSHLERVAREALA